MLLTVASALSTLSRDIPLDSDKQTSRMTAEGGNGTLVSLAWLMPLHPDVQALSSALHDLERFLRKQDQEHWAGSVGRCARVVDQSDAYGVEQFLRLFGGMGSLNDLVLWRDDDPLKAENEKLDELRSRAWTIANSLAHERR